MSDFENNPIAEKIHGRAQEFLTPNSSASYKGLVMAIDEMVLPNLPNSFDLHPGALNAYPGTLNAVFNCLAEESGLSHYLSPEMDEEVDPDRWVAGMREVYDSNPQRFYELAQERLHIVSYPFRVTPLQYLLAPINHDLTIVDVGAAGHISQPLLNSGELLSRKFVGKEEVLASLPNPEVKVKLGIGIEITPQSVDSAKWTKAGFWRGPSRKDRLEEFAIAEERAALERKNFPIIQADAMEQTIAPGSIDAISAIFAVHQLPDPEQFYRNCERVLRPGGIVMVIGTELIGGFNKTDYPGWRVDVYSNSEEGLSLNSTPFYLTENQAALDRVDLSEWEKYLESVS